MLLRLYEAVGSKVAAAEPWLSVLAAGTFISIVFAFFVVPPTAIFPLFLVTMWLCGLAMMSRLFSPRVRRDGTQLPSRFREAPALMRGWNLYFFAVWWAFIILSTIDFGFRVLRDGKLPAFHRVYPRSDRGRG
jgi:hypothetical protein